MLFEQLPGPLLSVTQGALPHQARLRLLPFCERIHGPASIAAPSFALVLAAGVPVDLTGASACLRDLQMRGRHAVLRCGLLSLATRGLPIKDPAVDWHVIHQACECAR